MCLVYISVCEGGLHTGLVCVYVCVSVAQKTLRSRCDVDDECRDVNSLCVSQTCRCLDNFYESNGVCRTFNVVSFVIKTPFKGSKYLSARDFNVLKVF